MILVVAMCWLVAAALTVAALNLAKFIVRRLG